MREALKDHGIKPRYAPLGAIRAPQPVQWLSDNGSIFTAHRTIEIAVALNLVPCFTPVESPESNFTAGIVKSSHGPAERLAFVDEPSVCIARA